MFSQEEKLKFLQDTIVPVTTLKKIRIIYYLSLQIQTKTHYLPFSFWNKKNSLGFDMKLPLWTGVQEVQVRFQDCLKVNFIECILSSTIGPMNWLLNMVWINKTGLPSENRRCHVQFDFWISKDTISTWYHSAKLSFNTQFTNGLRIQILAISKPCSSLYFMGVGAENIDKEKRRVFYISPLH
jgi:hypothetical protein